jgi:hypothetical protein
LASSDDEDYADQKIKPDASTKTEDETAVVVIMLIKLEECAMLLHWV